MAYIDNNYYKNTYGGNYDFPNADRIFSYASDVIDIYSGFKAKTFFNNSNGFFDSQIMRAVALQADYIFENNLLDTIKIDKNLSSESSSENASSSSNDSDFSQISLGKFSYKLGSNSSSASSNSSASSSKNNLENSENKTAFPISPISLAILEECGFTNRNISL